MINIFLQLLHEALIGDFFLSHTWVARVRDFDSKEIQEPFIYLKLTFWCLKKKKKVFKQQSPMRPWLSSFLVGMMKGYRKLMLGSSTTTTPHIASKQHDAKKSYFRILFLNPSSISLIEHFLQFTKFILL